MGYSVLFRRGLWAQVSSLSRDTLAHSLKPAQSSPIVKKLDALIKQAVATLQSFKKHFARQPPAADM